MADSTASPDLGELIDMQIRSGGPMSVATYMGLCLTHPSKGYYRNADPLGPGGDFITAPEISQMFGELIGFFFVNLWQQMREPTSFTLLELGPGRGTLMADMLRVAIRAPGFREALDLRLFETNPVLVEQQRLRLAGYNPRWLESLDIPGDGPILVIANEFFDAMPIRQFVKGVAGWHERQVGLKDGRRVFGVSPTPVPETSMPQEVRIAAAGEVYEAALAGIQVMDRLSQLVAKRGGGMLIIDYGYERTQTGETLQAVRKHAFADPLEAPGEVDLSAHVDFGALSKTAQAAGLVAHPLMGQGRFLNRMGLPERAEALSKANPEQADAIEAAKERLTASDQMGDLFKVLAITSPGLQPAGIVQ